MSKIPPEAKKVFEGVRFDVYQWDQRMFDGSIQVFESVRRVDTVEAIVTVGDRIILEVQEQPYKLKPFLSFIGGHMNKGETPEEAMRRETLEETGYEARRWKLLHTVNSFSQVDWNMYVFVGQDATRVQEPHLDCGERIQIRLVTLDELLELVDSGEIKRIEQDLRAMMIRAKYHSPAREALENIIFG